MGGLLLVRSCVGPLGLVAKTRGVFIQGKDVLLRVERPQLVLLGVGLHFLPALSPRRRPAGWG